MPRTRPLTLHSGTGATPVHTDRARVAQALARYTAESVAAPDRESTRTVVHEATMGGASVAGPGRLLVRLIRAGWSLNGNYYSADVLRRDGGAAWPAGTHTYVDHATDSEEAERPAGSVRNLAGVLTTGARWDETEQALFAEVRLFAPWREAITDMAEHIGMSIRAWVTGEDGEAEGRAGFVVASIPQGRSVDFVTVPAAGGGIVSVLESVGHQVPVMEARNVGAWLESRLHLALTQLGDDMYGDGRITRAERIVLSSAIGDGLQAWSARVEADAPQLFHRDPWAYPEPATTPAEEARRAQEATAEDTRTALARAVSDTYGAEDTWAYVRDFDPDRALVWFDVSGAGHSGLWQQPYVLTGRTASLTGARVEVTARTVYEPTAEPAVESTDAHPTEQRPDTRPDAENVTDGAPPTAPNPPTDEEPGMSGTEPATTPAQAGTATVADTPATNVQTPTVAQESPATVAALEAITAQLAQMQERLTAETARADQRDAENRAMRNTTRAREAVAEALRARDLADVAAQIGPRVTTRVLAAIPTTAEGVVDEAALTESISTAVADEASYVRSTRAQALEAAGVGQPFGLGATPPAQVDEAKAAFEAEMTSLFSESLGMTPAAAAIAAKGR